jgi:transposase
MRSHPGIEVVCRDRAECYGEGASQGAPNAIQVADRWHVLRNVTDALESVLGTVTQEIREVAHAVQPVPDGRHIPTSNERQKQAARDRRCTKFSRFQELLARHPEAPRYQIAQEAGISRTTLYRWLPLAEFPERKGMPPRAGPIALYEGYIQQRWAEGCHNGMQLFREIRGQGFEGTCHMVRHLVRDWRVPLRESKARQRRWVPSPRAVKWLILRPEQKRDPQEQAFVDELLQRVPIVAKAQELAASFSSLLRKEGERALDDWLIAAQGSGIGPMEHCAREMLKDKAAIAAAVEQSWSNGQTEGQVHRLKLIKRSMYGRARFDLLRACVLPMKQAS